MEPNSLKSFLRSLLRNFSHYRDTSGPIATAILICLLSSSLTHAHTCKKAVQYNSPKSVAKIFEDLWNETDYPSTIKLSKEQNDFYAKQSKIFLSKLKTRIKRLDQKKLTDLLAMLKSRSKNFQELIEVYRQKGNLTTAQWMTFSNELVNLADSIDLVQKFQTAKSTLDSFDEYSMRVLIRQIDRYFEPQWFLIHGSAQVNSRNLKAILIPLDYDLSIRDLLDFVGSGLTPMGMITTALRVDGVTMSPRTFAGHDASGHSGYRPGRLSPKALATWESIKSWANHPEPEINAIRHVLLHQFSHESSVFKDALEGQIQSELNLKGFALDRLLGRVRTEDFWGESILMDAKSLDVKMKLELEELQKFYGQRILL